MRTLLDPRAILLACVVSAAGSCAEAAAPSSGVVGGGAVDDDAIASALPTWDRWYLQTSVLTHHFHSDPAHDDRQHLIDLSYRFRAQWLVGAAVFDNSFGQSSQYLYGGWLTHPIEAVPALYLKVTAGAVHGYKDPYRDKIPYNSAGVAPGIIPAIGYCYRAVCSELVIFGGAGVTLTFGVKIP